MSDPKPSAAEMVEVFLRMGKAGHYTTALLEDIVFAARAEAVAPVLEVLRQMVAAMPRCDRSGCAKAATRYQPYEHGCDEHSHGDDTDAAAPLRAALALLAEHKEGT